MRQWGTEREERRRGSGSGGGVGRGRRDGGAVGQEVGYGEGGETEGEWVRRWGTEREEKG